MQVFGEIVPAAAEAAAQDDRGNDRRDPTKKNDDDGEKKDKDDEDDDADDDKEQPARTDRPMPRRGTKRKLETQEDEMEAGPPGGRTRYYSAQRQSVFNVFMCKLQRYRQVADPSLLRSVLICNTLRSIEREMVRDGFEPESSSGVAAEAAMASELVDTSGCNFVPPAFQQQTDADESMDSSGVAETLVIHPCSLPLSSSSASASSSMPMSTSASDSSPCPTYTAMLPLEPASKSSASSDVVGYEKSLGDLDCSGRATPYPSLDLDPCRTVEDETRIDVDDEEDEDDDDEDEDKDDDEDDERQGINWGSVLNFSSQVDGDPEAHPLADGAWTYGGQGREAEEEEEELDDELDDVDVDEDDDEDDQDQEHEDNRTGSGGPNTSPSSSSDSGISTASDEIFGDIDLSLYDFDLVPLSPPSSARTQPAVLPPSAEELLCSFPGERTIVLPPPPASAAGLSRNRAIRNPSGHTTGDAAHRHHRHHHRGTHSTGNST